MPLKKVVWLDYSGTGYAPDRRQALVNTDEVLTALPTEGRGDGPFTLIRFRDGSTMNVAGRPEQLLAPPAPDPGREALELLAAWLKVAADPAWRTDSTDAVAELVALSDRTAAHLSRVLNPNPRP